MSFRCQKEIYVALPNKLSHSKLTSMANHAKQGGRKHSRIGGAHAFRGTLTSKKGTLYIQICEKVGENARCGPGSFANGTMCFYVVKKIRSMDDMKIEVNVFYVLIQFFLPC